jgi:hypothetical protein
MISDEIKEKMRMRYVHVHPLLFQRSCEYAKTGGELFDILESIPELPCAWDQKRQKWVVIPDLTSVSFPDREG